MECDTPNPARRAAFTSIKNIDQVVQSIAVTATHTSPYVIVLLNTLCCAIRDKNETDDVPSPNDWMINSTEKDVVRQDIELLMALIAF